MPALNLPHLLALGAAFLLGCAFTAALHRAGHVADVCTTTKPNDQALCAVDKEQR